MVQCNTMGKHWEYSRGSMGMAREYQRNLGSNIRILLGITWEEHGKTVSILWEDCSQKHYGNSMERPQECHGNILGTRILLVYWGNTLGIARELCGNTMGIS